jgi:hypothetical protein
MTKKLENLLARYKKVNRVRLTAYARRSRFLHGIWDKKLNKRVWRVEVTPERLQEHKARIEVARLRRLEVSKKLLAYCKKKQYHIKWGTSNEVLAVYDHISWQLRSQRCRQSGNTFLYVLNELKLSSSEEHFH